MKKIYLFALLIFIITGCRETVTSEDLIGGKWIGTAGYQEGEIEGDPNCYPFHNGIEFKNKETAYIDTFERDFEYKFYESGTEITFRDKGPVSFAMASLNKDFKSSLGRDNYISYTYKIKLVNDDKLVLEGAVLGEGEGCVMERNSNS